jgi:glycosyltransferase involved in cell wall biosynthesis
MFSGAGTGVQMFAYMAAGIPAISTHKGARGLEAPHGTFLVCEASEFNKNLQMLVNNETLCHDMSKKAREFVEAKCDWKLIAKKAYSMIQSRVETH